MKILPLLMVGSLLAGVAKDCMEKQESVSSEGEMVYIEPAHVPRGPAGDWPKPACMEVIVLIAADGKTKSVFIKESSRSYPLDLAVHNAIAGYRFKVQNKNAKEFERSMFIYYDGKGPEISVVGSCS